MKSKSYFGLSILFFIGITFVTYFNAEAQASILVNIDRINDENFPQVEVVFSALDPFGYPVKGLTQNNLAISEDGNLIQDFSIQTTFQHPLDIVLVLDTSNTMGYGGDPTYLQVVIEATKSFFGNLPLEDQIAIVTYANYAEVVQDLNTDKNQASLILDTLEVSGDSAMYDGIMEAINLLEGNANRPVIVLLTDGVDSGLSAYTLDEVIDQLTQQKILLYTIAWRGADKDEIEKITNLVNGTTYFLDVQEPDVEAFLATYNQVAADFSEDRHQYRLSYTSGLMADNGEHDLNIAIDHLGIHAEGGRHFVAHQRDVTVNIQDFQDGQVICGPVTFVPDVISPAQIDKIEVYLDDALLDSVQSAPFEYGWDSSVTTFETHDLSFTVFDVVGNSGKTNLSLNVKPPVTILINSPLDDDTIGGLTTISTDVEVCTEISRVEFFVDDQLIDTKVSSPYEIEWDPSGLSVGEHSIKVSAQDVNGYVTSDQKRVNVAVQEGSGMFWVILIVILGGAGVFIPISLRKRKRKTTPLSSESEKHPKKSGMTGEANAVLRELKGLNPDYAWPISQAEIYLGRKRDTNDIPLKGLKASRQQAIIQFHQGSHVISSLKPENPILVNNAPVDQHVLQPGDIIRGGETILRYEIEK